MIPNYSEMEKTEEVPDKQCIICLKKDMDLRNLSIHYSVKHDLTIGMDEDDSTFEEWVEAKNNAKDYNSEDVIDEEEEHKSQASSTDSSSDSSSENKSQPQKRKKSHRRKESDKLRKQVNSAIEKVETYQHATNAKLDQFEIFYQQKPIFPNRVKS